ncbi:beta-eliminating lyase-related protein [Brevibacillus ruminantium]|uniref:Beta-eliminating lyase-related protein n=1 Tax=Brevibacillus ruminantium TaxID=2950604 RepID=A0ABY4W8H4_9BACL|nr:aminotransferase class I/II-fold pyridoxal phosphate-dependent enzyme [Brevibacillus ruminantium]USG63322.1 beta-eliminating lyase-related protein [Brevibacillus ruminantium]
MAEQKRLSEAYWNTAYPLVGHGQRTLSVLQTALQESNGQQVSDLYGKGELIESFQQKLADFLGKETAVFFPSGTMAQQIALRIWCDRKGVKRVAYHPLCHVEIHEEDGLKELHHIETLLLADTDRLIRLSDVTSMREEVSCLLLELPQREIGGELPEYQELEAISDYCRQKGIRLHLDGARLFEVLPYYKKSAAEIAKLFDSVYLSFYKGVGGIAGAILAGEEPFIEQAKVWKRRYGGDLISLYPYIVTADYYLEKRLPHFQQYYEQAKELAASYNRCQGVETRPAVPVSNMFHVHISLPKEKLEPLLIEVYEAADVGLIPYVKEKSGSSSSFEVNVGDQYAAVPKEKLERAFDLLNEKLTEAMS